jgi:hypothetical protein
VDGGVPGGGGLEVGVVVAMLQENGEEGSEKVHKKEVRRKY